MNHRLKSVILNKFGKGESFIQELKTSYTEAVGHMKLLYTWLKINIIKGELKYHFIENKVYISTVQEIWQHYILLIKHACQTTFNMTGEYIT